MATINDVVLIYFEDKPLIFARIEDISPDVKKGWYLVKLLFLQVPLQVVTWILREAYINGDEFTMNGKRMRIEKVECPEDQSIEDVADGSSKTININKGSKVISFSDLKKK
ncbi:MAG TPA: hypothetical protein HPQ03_15990 [Deltaproteobacteria bacterium]|nr:hypothetical protein [Deltaproteobacteria bacterium]